MAAFTDTAAAARTGRRRKASPKGVASALLTVELVVLALACAMLFAGLPFGIKAFGVMSGSMEPNIPKGSLVYVDANVPAGELAVGDVAAFDAGNGTMVTHRVVDIAEDGTLTTRGDANAADDPSGVAPADVVGKTVASVPVLGDAMLAFEANRMAVLLAIGGLTAALALASCLLPGNDRRR